MKKIFRKHHKVNLFFRSVLLIFSLFIFTLPGCDCNDDNVFNYNFIDEGSEKIFISTDGGENWTKHKMTTDDFKAIGYTYINTEYKIIAFSSSYYEYTTNLGSTWKDTSILLSDLSDLAFSPFDGVFSFTQGNNILFHSTDYASTWGQQNAGSTVKLKYIDFSPSTTNYQAAVGDLNDRIYLSTNGGNNWVFVNTGLNGTERFADIKFIRDNIIAAFGKDSLMLRSTDYGNSWNQQDLPDNASMTSLASNPEFQFVIGGSSVSGKYFFSNDLGISWEHRNFPSGISRSWIFSISYAGDIIGAGDFGEICKSTDRGLTWRMIQVGTINNIKDILYINNSLIVAVSHD